MLGMVAEGHGICTTMRLQYSLRNTFLIVVPAIRSFFRFCHAIPCQARNGAECVAKSIFSLKWAVSEL
jgi:hypothetical protein